MTTINSMGTQYPIEVAAGGTGENVMTQFALPVGGVTDLDYLAIGLTGEILIGNTAANPSWSSTPSLTSITATTLYGSLDTNVAAAGTTLSGTIWAADGTDANIDLTLTPKGTGTIQITGFGAGVIGSDAAGKLSSSGTTQYALQVGDATGTLDSLGLGTATQILQSGGAGANPAWSTATYPATAAIGTILIASGANTITTLAPDTAGYVLTDGGAGVAPSWVAPTVGTVTSVTGGTNISTSGTAADPVIDLDASISGMTNVIFSDGGAIQTDTTTAHTLTIDAYDVDGTAYKSFITLTNADDPTCDLDTDVTIGTKYIYRADGIDIPVTDGGTGLSSVTQGDLLYASAANTITALNIGTNGQLLTSDGTDASWQDAPDVGVTSVTAGTNINLTGTAADPVVNLDDMIALPTTSSTAGRITINGVDAIQMYGTGNFFAGGAGNFSLSGANYNIGIGSTALDSLTNGDNNIAIGQNSLTILTTGSNNVAMGYNAGAGTWYGVTDNVYIGANVAGTQSNNGNGIHHVAIGSGAMAKSSQNSDSGVFIGYNAATNINGNHLSNTVIGAYAFDAAAGAGYPSSDTPRYNTIVGTYAGSSMSGNLIKYNTLIGYGAGNALTASESSNICLGNVGVASDGNTIRIGTNGSGDNQQDTTYIAGIYGVTPGGTLNIALIDSNHQLGSVATLGVANGGIGAATLTDHGVLVGSGTGAITPLAVGTDGQVLLGSSAADPVFATLSSTGTIAFTPGAGTLALDCRAASETDTGVVELATDAEAIAGTASTVINCTSLKAKLGAQTSHGIPYGAGTDTAIAWTAEPTDGQILIGETGAIPQLGTLTAGTGITVTNAAHSITVASTGTTLNDQTGTTYTLVLTDAGKMVTCTNASAITVTVPANAAVAFPIGTCIGFFQGGAGQITLSGAVPPTLKSADDAYTTVKLYSCCGITKIDTDVWCVYGDVEA